MLNLSAVRRVGKVVTATTSEVGRPVDDQCFARIFHAEARRLVRLALLLGAEDPEDVVQEAFCRVFAARGRLRDDDDRLRGYLGKAVVNEARDRHRRAQVARRGQHLLTSPGVTTEPLGVAERDEVFRAIQGLPPRQREALVLRFWLDLPLADVAEAMGTRVGTAKSHVSRGLAAVSAALGPDRHDHELTRRQA